MPLQPGQISNEIKNFILAMNRVKQEDAAEAIDQFSIKIEKVIYEAIKSLTITIQPGFVIVAGSPTTQTNPAPIVLNRSVN